MAPAHVDRRYTSSDLACDPTVLGSVVIVVDAACMGRVIARAAQLPLAEDAAVTLVELYANAAADRSVLELHALRLLMPCRRLRCTSIGALDRAALLELVRSSGAELVVVGDLRFWGWHLGGLLGTVPVLLVRAPAGEGYQRPLVAIDPHGGAEEVLQFAREVLSTRCEIMTAVHAYTSVAEHARRFVASMLSSLGAFGAGWTRYLGRGDARTVISKAANNGRADLVVVGCRPRTLLSRLVFGSVSRGVLHDVRCDVLTVPITVPIGVVALPRAISGAQ